MDNEIKKTLYKEDTIAKFSYYRKGYLHYTAFVQSLDKEIYFRVPTDDAGDADFHDTMPAKLLIRYLNNGRRN